MPQPGTRASTPRPRLRSIDYDDDDGDDDGDDGGDGDDDGDDGGDGGDDFLNLAQRVATMYLRCLLHLFQV